MTILGIGKPTPTQLGLLLLSGTVLKGNSVNETPTKEEMEKAKTEGYKLLKAVSKKDNGVDVQDWINYLKNTKDPSYEHSYGYESMKSILESKGYDL